MDPNIARLYRATFLFGVACGVSIALTSLHLDSIHYGKQQIGTLAAWFASGVVLMSIPAGALIRRFSAKNTLIACMIAYAISLLAFPYMRSYSAIAFVRGIDGASSVGIWVASETILLSRAGEDRKAHLTSLYAVWLSSGYVAGSLLARAVASVAPMHVAFVVASGLAFATTLYVVSRFVDDGLGREAPVEEAERSTTSSLAILWRIKNSCFGTFAYGYFQASVVLFLPLYLIEEKAIRREQTIVIPALFCIGMLLASNAAGRIADRIGHLLVMRVLSVVGTFMILGFVFLDSYLLMCAAVFVAGATLAAMSPVSLALQGVVTEKKDYSRSNAIYNVFYAAGMLLGPPISSVLFARGGGRTMLFQLVGLYVAFIVFTIVFMNDDPATSRAVASPAAD
ncbi:MAG: MFS transporter [Polyangiales bacterium]